MTLGGWAGGGVVEAVAAGPGPGAFFAPGADEDGAGHAFVDAPQEGFGFVVAAAEDEGSGEDDDVGLTEEHVDAVSVLFHFEGDGAMAGLVAAQGLQDAAGGVGVARLEVDPVVAVQGEVCDVAGLQFGQVAVVDDGAGAVGGVEGDVGGGGAAAATLAGVGADAALCQEVFEAVAVGFFRQDGGQVAVVAQLFEDVEGVGGVAAGAGALFEGAHFFVFRGVVVDDVDDVQGGDADAEDVGHGVGCLWAGGGGSGQDSEWGGGGKVGGCGGWLGFRWGLAVRSWR